MNDAKGFIDRETGEEINATECIGIVVPRSFVVHDGRLYYIRAMHNGWGIAEMIQYVSDTPFSYMKHLRKLIG